MNRETYPLESFWNNGFCILRNVFSPALVEEWRAAGEAFPNRDMFSHDLLHQIILHPSALSIARTILGTGELVYFGDSNAMVGKTDPGFHKDNADKDDENAPDWQGDYPIIRFGLYTGDHVKYSGGLDLRQGSHRTVSVSTGHHVAARTQPGDLVIWNLRTSHSGGTMLLRNGTPLDPSTLLGKVARRMSVGLLAPSYEQRVGLFWTYAIAGAHLDRYIAYLKTRRYAVERWQDAAYRSSWLEEAKAAGVTVREVAQELAREPAGPLHANHVALSY